MDPLELQATTPAQWAERVLERPLELLSDHAHCELGAAAAAQSLIARLPGHAELVDRLSALAAEEMRHFRRVHRLLVRLGGALAPTRANPYVDALRAAVARSAEPDAPRLLDRLLVAGLIERRSLERFELLARAAREPALGALWSDLCASEAAHARLFLELAGTLWPARLIGGRLQRLCGLEAEVARAQPFAARIHAGLRTEAALQSSGPPAERPPASSAW